MGAAKKKTDAAVELTVVDGGKKPTPKTKTLQQAIEGGDYLEILIAQRAHIAESLPSVTGPALAALHRQLGLVAKEIAQIEQKRKEEEDVRGDSDEDEDEDWDPHAND